ncbi:MAG: hypothetical protein ACP5N1_05855 [Candidatus Woesearchaeota archaeon]
MDIKKTFRQTIGLAAIVVAAYSCGPVVPAPEKIDSSYSPYTLIKLEDIKNQPAGSRIMVEGELKTVEDERIILQSGSQISSVLRNDYALSSASSETIQDGVAWDSIAPLLRSIVKDKNDTTNLYGGQIRVIGVVDTNNMLQMRFFEVDGKLYDAFKKN